MDQKEILRRLCNGALAQILTINNTQEQNSQESILNKILINAFGQLICRTTTNSNSSKAILTHKSTQTEFKTKQNFFMPLIKLPTLPRRNCIR
jgi:hypothetical protein